MTAVTWENGDLPNPVKAAAFQIIDKVLREPGRANGNAKIMIHPFGKNSLALVSSKGIESGEANAYLLGIANSAWFQLEQSIEDHSDYHSHPKKVLIGDFLKDYDQVVVIGRKSGWECGKVILIKGEKVTVQELQCEPSSC